MFFAFGSDLAGDAKAEFARYQNLDPDWKEDPVVKVMCILGRGYWYFSGENRWKYQPATKDFAEALILLAHVVNTLVRRPIVSQRPAPLFGDYLRPPDLEAEE